MICFLHNVREITYQFFRRQFISKAKKRKHPCAWPLSELEREISAKPWTVQKQLSGKCSIQDGSKATLMQASYLKPLPSSLDMLLRSLENTVK